MSQASKVIMRRFYDAKTAINSSLQISTFLADNGIAVESNRQICCPLHDDSTPSFSVNFATNEWKCFGCPDGGHYIDIWQKLTNKRTGSNYTIYSAVDNILKQNPEICAMLGFETIYQSYDEEFDLFKQAISKQPPITSEETGADSTAEFTDKFNFEEILQESETVKYISTETLERVMHKLKDADINTVVDFISDCEIGLSEEQLIAKYYHDRVSVSDFIAQMKTDSENDEKIIDSIMEALADD